MSIDIKLRPTRAARPRTESRRAASPARRPHRRRRLRPRRAGSGLRSRSRSAAPIGSAYAPVARRPRPGLGRHASRARRRRCGRRGARAVRSACRDACA